MTRLIPLVLALAACEPATATIDPTDSDAPAGPALACDQAPASVAGLDELPVTRFYAGPLALRDPPVEDDTFVAHTSVQREWSVIEGRWAPEGTRFGNLDADPEFAGHGVLAGAYRSSTCGMEVLDVQAWRLPDEDGTTYVEVTIEDSSGGCDTACSMVEWVGAAFAVPIADFPFSGPEVGGVEVVDACE